jgi:capsular exopolysaccharide synthesis family protein
MHESPVETGAARSFLGVLRRRLWLLMLCLVIGGGVAYGVSHSQQKQYSATASLLFQQNQLSQELFGFTSSTPVDPTTQAATNITLVSQPGVAVAAARQLGTTPATLGGTVAVAAAGASDVVNVVATDPSPTRAAKIANAYATAFIKYRQSSDRSQIVEAATQLQRQITRLESNQAASSTPAGASNLRDLRTRLSQLEVLTSTQTGDVQLAQAALIPPAPSSPSPPKDAALGLIAGLLVGAAAIFVIERLDRTVRDSDEARRITRLPLLGVIPSSRALSRGRLSTAQGPSPELETFSLLRTQLQYFNVDREIRSVLISSAAPGDGKSTVALNLARAAAAASDSRVLLVDADLRRPAVAANAGVAQAPGLSELLTHNVAIEDVVQSSREDLQPQGGASKFDILTSGAIPPNPAQLLESRGLQTVLEELHARYDFVVIDAPPTSVVSDAIPLMSEVSGVVVVVRIGQTRRDGLRNLRDQLSSLDVNVLGFVANDMTLRSTPYRYYYGAKASPGSATNGTDPSPMVTRD